MTQERVSRSLDWRPGKLVRIEAGKSPITITDLRALLDTYGVTSEGRRERLETLARHARQHGWWENYRDTLDVGTLQYAGYLTGASVIRHFQNAVIPGPLQTRAYGTVLTANYVDDSTVDRKVEFRQELSRQLDQRAAPPLRLYVLDEAVIQRYVGARRDASIMPEQLRYVADLAEGDDSITVRIVPFGAGAHIGMAGPFVLMEFEGGAVNLLYREAAPDSRSQSTVTTDEVLVADYRSNFEVILEGALSGGESIERLREVADRFSAR